MDDVLVALTATVALAALAQVVAAWLRIPAIVPLLAAGVIAGPAVTGLVDPSSKAFDQVISPFVSLAVGVILFEGALGLRREHLQSDVRGPVVRLLTFGVLTTWVLASAGAALFLDFSFELAVLVGAIVIVSGPTVVLPLLSFIRATPRTERVLRWEGVLVDPVGALIAVLVFTAIDSSGGFHFGGLALSVGLGAAVGLAGAGVLLVVLASGRLSAGQAAVATLGVVVLVTGLADALRDDSGLVAAIATGAVMANQRRVQIGDIATFKETLGLVLVSVLFVLLSALVKPSDVVDLGVSGLLFLALLVVIARPLATLLSTAGTELGWRERGLMAWMAPRGIIAAATASTFGLALVDDHIAGADRIVPVVFLVIVGTVVLYGLTAPAVARALGAVRAAPRKLLVVGATPALLARVRDTRGDGVEVDAWAPSAEGRAALEAAGARVVPGEDLLEAGDTESPLAEVASAHVATGDEGLDALLVGVLAEQIAPDRVSSG